MSVHFAGKVVLVTGASRGIGRAVALASARSRSRSVAVSAGQITETAMPLPDSSCRRLSEIAETPCITTAYEPNADETEMPPPFRHMTPLSSADVARAVVGGVAWRTCSCSAKPCRRGSAI